MSSFDSIVQEKLKKLNSGKFEVDDLSDHLKQRMKPGVKVVPLRKRRWTKVGEYWVFLKEVHMGTDDSWIEVLVVKKVRFICNLLFEKPIAMGEWGMIPDTNLTFEMWFVGDSVNSVPLVVEVIENNDTDEV